MSRLLCRCLLSSFLATSFILQGCATPPDISVVERPTGDMQIDLPSNSRIEQDDVCHALRYHVLDFNEYGQLEFPKSNLNCFDGTADYRHQCDNTDKATPGQTTPDQRLKCHIDAIRDSIEAGHVDGTPYDHIMLVVHGGLVSEDEGLREAIAATSAMSKDTDPEAPSGHGHYYTIFVVWRSGALATYAEQATRLEQGKRSPKFAGAVAPLTIAGDLARGVVREPRFGASEGLRLWNSTLRHKFSLGDGEFTCKRIEERMLAERIEQKTPADSIVQDPVASTDPYTIVCSEIKKSPDSVLKRAFNTTAYVASTPIRMVTTPILLGPGQASWENMQRRARDLVWRDSTQRDQILPDIVPPAVVEGGLQVVLEDLLLPLTQGEPGTPARYKLTLIGHSMGAMVVTELVRLQPELKFDNLVLMGAAVDMRGFVYALRSAQAVRADQAHVYNLALHPDNEVFELSGGGILPSGSLLQWIDEAYQTPPTQLDRVLGKWTNLPALERAIPPSIAHNVTFKMFGFDKGEPQSHGSFNDLDMCYWRKSYWDDTPWPTHRSSCELLLRSLKRTAR